MTTLLLLSLVDVVTMEFTSTYKPIPNSRDEELVNACPPGFFLSYSLCCKLNCFYSKLKVKSARNLLIMNIFFVLIQFHVPQDHTAQQVQQNVFHV